VRLCEGVVGGPTDGELPELAVAARPDHDRLSVLLTLALDMQPNNCIMADMQSFGCMKA
jgi:hypothetical protein